MKKIERQYWEVEDSSAEALKVKDTLAINYCTKFQWDLAKYKLTGVSLSDIVSQIVSTVGGVEEELKKLGAVLAEKSQNLSGWERKKIVNFSTSDFEDFIETKDVDSMDIYDSEYLVTMMCVVPAAGEEGNRRS